MAVKVTFRSVSVFVFLKYEPVKFCFFFCLDYLFFQKSVVLFFETLRVGATAFFDFFFKKVLLITAVVGAITAGRAVRIRHTGRENGFFKRFAEMPLHLFGYFFHA